MFADPIGFDGQQVTLGLYYPNLSPTSIEGFGVATVTSGTTTFSNLNVFPQPGVTLVVPDITLNGSVISYQYSASDAGSRAATAPFNGEVFTTFTPANTPESVTGVSLLGTNITGLTASSLSFSANTIRVNDSGIVLPGSGSGFAQIGVTFGVPPPPPSSGAPPQLVAPSKSENEQQFYKNLGVAYGVSAGVFAVAAATPCDGLCGAISGAFGAVSTVLLAKDPIDLNYTIIATPDPPSTVALPEEGFLTTDTSQLFNDIEYNNNQIIGLLDAAQTSLNRANGAFVSGDAQFEMLQLNALNTYISQEVVDSTSIGNDLTQLSELLPNGTGLDNTQLLSLGNDFLSASANTPEPASWMMMFVGAVTIAGLRLHSRITRAHGGLCRGNRFPQTK
ncbi:MAG: hypothetical protein JOZ32_19100 [Bryobacterales bacterium]|nr:hypothetical protein [Bryobacterales bacterium]